MRILVVDDSKAMRMIVMRAVRQAGFAEHTFEEAADGSIALDVIRSAPPDLVLCDWNMPELNGIDLLRALKAEAINVKFGFVTSECTTEMRHIAAEAGALFLVAKPFTADVIKSALAVLG